MNKNKTRQRFRRVKKSTSVVNLSSNIPTYRSTLPRPIVCRVPAHLQLMPDELDSWGRIDVPYVYTGSSYQATTWKINGPYNLFGPQVNWTGAFAANVPAGSAQLIETTTAQPAGSEGFYSSSTIQDAEFQVEIIPTYQANTPPAYIWIVPSLTADLSAVPNSALREQRGVIVATIPGQIGAQAPVREPTKLNLKISMSDLFGVTRDTVLNNPNYAQIPLVNPTVLGYVHVIVSSIDGSTAMNFTARHTVWLHHRFRRTNVMNSSAPI